MRKPKITYRNVEERIYLLTLRPLGNILAHQEGKLEEAEDFMEKSRGGKGEANARTNVMKCRRTVLYARKLLASVTACEPAICRGEEPTKAEIEAWDNPLG